MGCIILRFLFYNIIHALIKLILRYRFLFIHSKIVKKVEDKVEKIIKEGNDVKVKVNAEINLTTQKQG